MRGIQVRYLPYHRYIREVNEFGVNEDLPNIDINLAINFCLN